MAGRDDGGYGFVDPRPRMDPADMGPHIGPGRGYRMVECMDAWGRAGRTYAELAERVPRADGSPGHVSKSMLAKMRKNPERVSPAQAKAIADAAAEVSGLDWRYVVSGEILARSLRSETDIAKDARYRESLRAARSAAQVVIDATAEPRTMASVPLAQAFAALAMLAHMAGMEGEEKTMRAFVDVATADAATSYQRAWLDEEQMKRKELEKAARVDVL